GVSAARRLFVDTEGRGRADTRPLFRFGHRSRRHHRTHYLSLPGGRERRDRPRHHRARARRRHEGAESDEDRHPVERRAAARNAVLLRLVEGRDHARLRWLGDLRDRRVESRHREHDDDRECRVRRAARVRRAVRARAARRAALRRLFTGRSARHRVGAPQDRIRHGLNVRNRRLAMLIRLAALAAGLFLTLVPATAQEKIKFTLDWKLQGIHAWYYWAAEKGYFKAEGLDVSIDQGEGS